MDIIYENAAREYAEQFDYECQDKAYTDFIAGVQLSIKMKRGKERNYTESEVCDLITEFLETGFISNDMGYMPPEQWFREVKHIDKII